DRRLPAAGTLRIPTLRSARLASVPGVIEPIEDVPAGVIGFLVTGAMTDADYAAVFAPALKQAASAGEVRLLLVGAEGFDLGSLKSRFEAARKDPELDLGHSKDWRRVAVVAEANFLIRRPLLGRRLTSLSRGCRSGPSRRGRSFLLRAARPRC